MKKFKLFYVFIILSICFISCKTLDTQQSGKEDMAYLLFVSLDRYAGNEIFVTLDNNPTFSAIVEHDNNSNFNGTRYGVNIGTRNIKVVDNNNNVIYQKKIFLSTQEIKKIVLP